MSQVENTEDIFYKISRKDSGFIPQKTVEISLQLCDSNNKTATLSFTNTESSNVMAITLYIHGGRVPLEAGTSRFDDVLRVNGATKFIGRIDSVKFVQ